MGSRWIADIDDDQAEFVDQAILHGHHRQLACDLHVECGSRHLLRHGDDIQYTGVAAHVTVVSGDIKIGRRKEATCLRVPGWLDLHAPHEGHIQTLTRRASAVR